MLESIKKMCKQHPNIISNARGLGTFSSFDGATPEVRDQVVQRLKNIGKFIYFKNHFLESLNVYFNYNLKGIQCGGSGDKTFRIRPSLIFTKKHADIFLDRLDKVLVSFK
jgi:4-aminobutyrate aminotransferase/(S)-3-amino-2-methylpropionate transaminase